MDLLLAWGLAALVFTLVALGAVTRMLLKGPQWPVSSAHDEADDRGEAVSAPTPLSLVAPASPHPDAYWLVELPREEAAQGLPSVATFLDLDPDGLCAWCFEPRSECRHREFFFST